MRLINTHTLQMEEFFDVGRPKYAILSHRWRDGEVLLQDMQDIARASIKAGFAKIQRTCEQAIADGFDYVWVDTCCIDKTSSVELGEAINSMFRWYRDSSICYAYLWDVTDNTIDNDHENNQVQSSDWFSRGWTLQELIAPSRLSFYGQNWQYLGSKDSICELLAQATGIDEDTLKGASLRNSSIAQKMFWASKRQTTRIEDTAYCLLGIFDIYIPLIYGEGEQAFQRLQEEIIKRSTDHTIFAWHLDSPIQHGLLADRRRL